MLLDDVRLAFKGRLTQQGGEHGRNGIRPSIAEGRVGHAKPVGPSLVVISRCLCVQQGKPSKA